MQNAIMIETNDGLIAVPVKNFSKENCIEAIAKTMKIDKDKIEYRGGSMLSSVFGVKEFFPKVKDLFSSEDYESSRKYFHTINIKHGKISL